MKNRRPGLQDVADVVGVSKMTISRYLRDPKLVSDSLQKKIKDALDHSGYIPNRAPEILSNAKSKAIGVLLPSLTNQVFAEVLRGIESVTDAHGYQTMIAHFGYSPEREEKRLTSLLSYNVDGIILTERTHTERTRQMLQVAGIPVIEIMDSVSPYLDMAVGFDNFEAARQMTHKLITRGRKKIVYLSARQDERSFIKQNGYEQAMRDAGLEPRCVATEEASSYSLGTYLFQKTLHRYPDTDGIFSTNDDLAIGAIFECQRVGIAVPGDISIAGFHGHDVGQAMSPRLASVLTPREKMGEIAARNLLKRLNGETIPEACVDLSFTILEGGSL